MSDAASLIVFDISAANCMHSTFNPPLRRHAPMTAAKRTSNMVLDEAGQGQDVLLLVHGHPFDRSMWRPEVRFGAGQGWRVIAPDLAGYGESEGRQGPTTLDDFARDLVSLLDQLGVQHAVVAGLSMGGQIVMEM